MNNQFLTQVDRIVTSFGFINSLVERASRLILPNTEASAGCWLEYGTVCGVLTCSDQNGSGQMHIFRTYRDCCSTYEGVVCTGWVNTWESLGCCGYPMGPENL